MLFHLSKTTKRFNQRRIISEGFDHSSFSSVAEVSAPFWKGANHHRILALRFSTMLKISRADTHKACKWAYCMHTCTCTRSVSLLIFRWLCCNYKFRQTPKATECLQRLILPNFREPSCLYKTFIHTRCFC